MPTVRMTKNQPAAADGIHVRLYQEGQEYDVSDRLAKILINSCNAAKLVEEDAQLNISTEPPIDKPVVEEPVKRERKSLSSAPDNKMVASVPENASVEPKGDEGNECVKKVYQLSDELGISSKHIQKAAKECGINATTANSGLTATEIARIKAILKKK